MKQEDWTERLRQQMDGHEQAAPADLWADIEGGVERVVRRRAAVVALRRWAVAAALALLVAGGALVLWPRADEEPAVAQVGAEPQGEPLVADAPTVATQPVAQPTAAGPTAAVRRAVAQAEVKKDAVEDSVAGAEPAVAQVTDGLRHEDALTAEKTPDAAPRTHAVRPVAVKTRPRRTVSVRLYAMNGADDSWRESRVQMSRDMMARFGGYAAGARTAPVYLTDFSERHDHGSPVSAGLSLSWPVTDRLSLTTGVVGTRLSSTFTYVMHGETAERTQTLHYVGVPLGVQLRLADWHRLKVYATAGGQADWNVTARQRTGDGDSRDIAKDRWQWSVGAGVGIELGLLRRVGIYYEPTVRHYFDNGSDIQNYFKEKPTCVNQQMGLRVSF